MAVDMEKLDLNDAQIWELYEEAFPQAERKPIPLLRQLSEKGREELWVLRDRETKEKVGLAFFSVYKKMVLFDYFAICKDVRSKGYGGQALQAVREQYAGRRLFGEVEVLDPKADNYEQRRRRMDFYLRNGLHAQELEVKLFQCQFQILHFEQPLTFRQYRRFYMQIFGMRRWLTVWKNVKKLREE